MRWLSAWTKPLCWPLILLFLSTSLVNSKTIWNLERWRDGDSKQARMMDYNGFKPSTILWFPEIA